MGIINLLSDDTINKIAAGEVVERPMSAIKEMLENSIDAGSKNVSVQIKGGGISFIRITDDGKGIEKDDIKKAFLRHATSKINDANDLSNISSLGFRGEALASIAAVSKCEIITKTNDQAFGYRYVIEGGKEISLEEIGAPVGTTIIIRDLFFNTPARRKFLKSESTETANIVTAVSKIALSHPEVSIKLDVANTNKLYTSGNGNKKEVIYSIYGKDITSQLTEVNYQNDYIKVTGFIGKPALSRGNRSYELFEINGRSINSNLLNRAAEEAYKTFVMQHKFPVVILSIQIDLSEVDVNVHPAKLEVRFKNEDKIFSMVHDAILSTLTKSELIKEESFAEKPTKKVPDILDHKIPEPFEKGRIIEDVKPYKLPKFEDSFKELSFTDEDSDFTLENSIKENIPTKILSHEVINDFRFIGIVFDTYLLIEYKNEFLMIDQHAAHEKVMYERFIKDFKNKTHTSQRINPPIILSLTDREQNVINENIEKFNEIGYEIEPFGGRDFAVTAVPGNIFDLPTEDLLIEIIDDLADETGHGGNDLITDKIAMMSCKAAVKGNMKLSIIEAKSLIGELLSLEHPYTCPHGRSTAIKMSKSDIEKKFKRIL